MIFIFIFFIFFILFIILINYNTDDNNQHAYSKTITEYQNKLIGIIGEKEVLYVISMISGLKKILTNLYIPTVKGNTTEVDLIAFTDNCIIVIYMVILMIINGMLKFLFKIIIL